MQIDSAAKLDHNISPRQLRIEKVPTLNRALNFLYVGKDIKIKDVLLSSFRKGFMKQDFSELILFLKSEEAKNQRIDVVLVDIAFNYSQIKKLAEVLKGEGISHIPVVINEKIFLNKSITIDLDFIDDVIDFEDWRYDLPNKIKFLKKVNEEKINEVERNNVFNVKKSISKRLFDILVASLLVILLLPVLLLIAIAIKIESKGPVLYKSKRAGNGFRIFNFYKFRTMEVNADKKVEALKHLNQYGKDFAGPNFFKIVNDPRVTKVGKFLRNTSLDELPQLLNVIKGDMSLVGNRPLPLYEAATLTTNESVERFMAPAGITGLWQIKKRGKGDMSTQERIELDIHYARNFNLLYDFWIMLNTPKALFQKNNV